MSNWIQRFLAAITTHKGDASAHHAKYTNGEAVTAVKAGVKLNELQAPDGAVAFNSQKASGLAAAAVAGDAIVADANVRAPDSSALEGSNKATVQDHTPKAHTLASHSAGRIGKDRLQWTADKLLKGAGATSDPTEIDVPAAALFSGLVANLPTNTDMIEGAIFLCLDQAYLKEIVSGAWVSKYSASYYTYPACSLANFQTNPATGNFAGNVERVNDNSTAATGYANGIDQYAEVDLGAVRKINQWRDYGSTNNNGSGRWKLQYKDAEGDWIDWVTDIVINYAAEWRGMQSESEVITQYIRLVATTLDTQFSQNHIAELEVYHS